MKICKQAVLMFGLVLVLTGGAFAQDVDSDDSTAQKTLSEKCADEWEDSDANDYCTGTVTTTATLDNGTEKCTMSASCTVTINLITQVFDGEVLVEEVHTPRTYTKTFPSVTRKLTKVDRLTLCFGIPSSTSADDDYKLMLRNGCTSNYGEFDAAFAVANGLSNLSH